MTRGLATIIRSRIQNNTSLRTSGERVATTDINRRARYDTITKAGRRALGTEVVEWKRFVADVDVMLLATRAGLRDGAGLRDEPVSAMSRWLGMKARLRNVVFRQSADARMAEIVEDLWTDLRFALRSLRRGPSLALVLVLTFTLGIGASTAMFSVLNGIALRQLPVRNARNIAVLWTASPQQTTQHWPLTYAELTDYRAATSAFVDIAGVAFQGAVDVVMRDGSRAVPLAATWVPATTSPSSALRLLPDGCSDQTTMRPAPNRSW